MTIPAAAKPGTDDVPFSATLANGQVRPAGGKLTVLGGQARGRRHRRRRQQDHGTKRVSLK